MKLSDLLTVCAAWPPSPPLPALPAEHEMGGGCLCHEHRHGDPAFVASQDAWFDSKPDEMDDEYIKWRDGPSTCIPCAPTAALSPKPAAARQILQPPIVALGLFARWGNGGPFVAGDVEQPQPQQQPQPPQQPQALPEQELAIAVAANDSEEQTPTESFSTGQSDPYCRWPVKMGAPGATADFLQPPIVALGLFAR
jgi:hypothetical protein